MKQTATQFKMPGIVNALNISSRHSFDMEPWAAFYCRLSQDDGLEGESNSIQHHDVMYRGWNTPKNITS